MHQTVEDRVFYCSVVNGDRRGYLLGPYETKGEADANVNRARELAETADPYAHFYLFGVCNAPREVPIRPVFGK